MPSNSIKFKALEVVQPIGVFYCGSMKAIDLVSITHTDVRSLENDLDTYLGIQRPLKQSRVREISSYVKGVDATFPNSIIVAVSDKYIYWNKERQQLEIEFEDGEKEKVAKVLDGQHRLAGFDESSYTFFDDEGQECDFELLVTVFVETDLSTQANIFATVNLAQTKVNKSLVYDLESLASARSPERTCHDIAVTLNKKAGSPFERRIKRLGVATPGVKNEAITQAAFVENLLKLISPQPKEDRNVLLSASRSRWGRTKCEFDYLDDKSLSRYVFRKSFVNHKDEVIAANVYNFFSAVDKLWHNAWNKNNKNSVLNKTVGLIALIRSLRDYYKYFNPDYIKNHDFIVSIQDYYSLLEKSNLDEDHFYGMEAISKSAGELYKSITGPILK